MQLIFINKNRHMERNKNSLKQMRHSVEVASMNYAKVFDEDDEPAGKPSEDVEELNKENF